MPNQKTSPPVENGLYGGFIRKRPGIGPSVQIPVADEMSRIDDPVDASARLAQSNANKKAGGKGRWPKGPSLTKKRRCTLSIMGIPERTLQDGDPRYKMSVRMANVYRKTRMRELAVAHGYVSSGASSLLATSALALASSRYLYEMAAQGETENVPQLLKQASQLADSARQNELAAWELCAREAVARKRNMAADMGAPWLVPADGPKRTGRPRKEEQSKEVIDIPPIGSDLSPWLAGDQKQPKQEVPKDAQLPGTPNPSRT